MEPMRRRRIAKLFVFVLPAFLIVFAGLVWAVSALWNGLMPSIFGLRAITYWQALGLMVLSWILFGGLRGRAGHRPWPHRMRRGRGRMAPPQGAGVVQGPRRRCRGGSPPRAPPPAREPRGGVLPPLGRA